MKAIWDRDFDQTKVSVVSWILPQTAETKEKCRAKTNCSTFEWQMVRVHGDECNRALAKALEQYLISLSYAAVAPMCSEQFTWGDSERFSVISNWSERHTAHIAGLGTFGLCDALITPLGKAVRIGSVIVNCRLEKTPRLYKSYNEYCFAARGCTACIKRCPAGAITPNGHDKAKCRLYHAEVITKICREEYGYNGYSVCGLCQTGTPCESGIPSVKK